MNVRCESCRTQFRLPPEISGAARVRCSRCGNTFVVYAGQDPPPPGVMAEMVRRSTLRPRPLSELPSEQPSSDSSGFADDLFLDPPSDIPVAPMSSSPPPAIRPSSAPPFATPIGASDVGQPLPDLVVPDDNALLDFSGGRFGSAKPGGGRFDAPAPGTDSAPPAELAPILEPDEEDDFVVHTPDSSSSVLVDPKRGDAKQGANKQDRLIELFGFLLALMFGVTILFFRAGSLDQVPEAAIELIAGPRARPLSPDALAEIDAEDVSVFSHETAGHSMIVVTGNGVHRGVRAFGRVRVVVYALRDGGVVARESAWLGLTFSATDLEVMRSKADLDRALRMTLETQGPPLYVTPGKTLPFQVLFLDPIERPEELSFRVEFEEISDLDEWSG